MLRVIVETELQASGEFGQREYRAAMVRAQLSDNARHIFPCAHYDRAFLNFFRDTDERRDDVPAGARAASRAS